MKSTGIVRRVDKLGRIVLPMELRRNLDLSIKDEMEIYTEQDKIILKKYQRSCVFCSKSENLVEYKERSVCTECLAELKGSSKK